MQNFLPTGSYHHHCESTAKRTTSIIVHGNGVQSGPWCHVWCAEEQERFAQNLQSPTTTWGRFPLPENYKSMASHVAQPAWVPRKIKSIASFYLTLKYACAKRQYSPQASWDHSKQSGKGTTSSPLIGQIQIRYPKPRAQILSNTHWKLWKWALMWTIHAHDSFENSKGENATCCPTLPPALSIKGDVTLGIPSSRPLGWKWRCVGVECPSAGKLVLNPALDSVLPNKMNFTQKEWAAFSMSHLHFDDYIMSKIHDNAHYFWPAASKFEQWACKSEALEEYTQMTPFIYLSIKEKRNLV